MNDAAQSAWIKTVSERLAKADGDFTKAVNSLEPELTTAAFLADTGVKAGLFSRAFDMAGLDAQQRKDVIAAFAGASSTAVSQFLASEIKGVLQSAEVQRAPLPKHAREVRVSDQVSFISLQPNQGYDADPKTWHGVSLFDVPATCWVIPQLAWGSAGGVAQGLISHARQLAAKDGKGDQDPRVIAAESWQRRIEQAGGKAIQRGEVSVVNTESDSPRVFAPRLALAQTVAPDELQRPTKDFATNEEWLANRQMRFDYARSVITQMLNKTIQSLKNDPDLQTSEDNRGVIVMPLLLTGPKGTLYEGEAGALYREILDKAAADHPEFEFKIALYDGDRRQNFHTVVVPDFEAQFTGAAKLSNHPIPAQGPSEAWAAFAASGQNADNAKPVGVDVVRQNLDTLSKSLLGSYKDSDVISREIATTQLSRAPDRRLLWHLHRLAEIPEIYNAFVPPDQRTQNKDEDGLQPVTKKMLENLLKSPELLKQLTEALGGFKFAPDRADTAVSLMAAKILQERRLEVVSRNMDAMQKVLAEKDAQINDLIAQLGGKRDENEELSLRVGMAQKKLDKALKQNTDLEAALEEYKEQITALKGDNRLLGKDKAALQARLDQIEAAQTDRVRTATRLRASASSESASRSYG
ncbi:MAG: hypothetical protein IT384_30255 [Deltaproteobacteria bacterium]|nr:hypothetical protein [Deltaproteobacteria bacterium]